MLKIEKIQIADKIGKLKGIISTKTPDAVKGILLKNNMLTAYNMEFGAQYRLDGNNDESFILPMNAIDLILKLPDDEIIFKYQKNQLEITSGDLVSRFATIPVENFPEIPTIESPSMAVIDSQVLNSLITKVFYAVAEAPDKPVLGGVYVDASDGYINVVGCDSYRLSWLKHEYNDIVKFIIPKTAAQKLVGLNLNGNIQILSNEKVAIIKSDDATFFSRTYAGPYPEYKKIIPQYKNHIEVDGTVLLSAIERCIISTSESSSDIEPIRLLIKKNQITIFRKTKMGEYTEDIPVLTSIDGPLEFGFNPRYLVDTIKNAGEKFTLYYKSNLKSIVLEENNKTALLTPMRLN